MSETLSKPSVDISKLKSKRNTSTDKMLNFKNFTTKPLPQSVPNLSAELKFLQSEKASHQTILISNPKKNLNKNREPDDLFIDSLVEGKETILPTSEKKLTPELTISKS